jgi:hypothetical protein
MWGPAVSTWLVARVRSWAAVVGFSGLWQGFGSGRVFFLFFLFSFSISISIFYFLFIQI